MWLKELFCIHDFGNSRRVKTFPPLTEEQLIALYHDHTFKRVSKKELYGYTLYIYECKKCDKVKQREELGWQARSS